MFNIFNRISIYSSLFIFILLLLVACGNAEVNTDKIPLVLMTSTPATGTTSVDVNATISFVFTEAIVLSPTSKILLNNQVVSATVSPQTLTISPITLKHNTTYTLVIPGNAISDKAGNFAKEISISFVTTDSFNITPSLVTPNPSAQVVKLYNFLKLNFGTKVISATMANYSTNIIEATWVYNNTGKWPAMTTFDFIDHTNQNQNWINYTAPFTLGQDWWNNNGIVSLMWHWRDPLTKSGAFYTANTSFDITKINDSTSVEYKAMIADIDLIASYLKQFKDAGIPVIWRPLHEASGGWFWWGAHGAAPCKALWKVMFNRLVNYHGLNNLIWVWTSDTSSSAIDWYPGDNYVDIIGMDIYPNPASHASQSVEFNKIRSIFNNKKLITLSECGSVPDPGLMKTNGDMWSWFMPWNGDYTESDAQNGATWWKKFFSYDYVITRDKMPSLK
ncbi:MAG: glycosyl hydrolase [Paludibacter sp.]|nr:glycosyl hydrolase [Paludibacter sp.]